MLAFLTIAGSHFVNNQKLGQACTVPIKGRCSSQKGRCAQMILSIAAQSLWAKKSVTETGEYWLPLSIHMKDSTSLARKLWEEWLPMGTKKQIARSIRFSDGSCANLDTAGEVLAFLAGAHDLGKASPVFQSKSSPATESMDHQLDAQLKAAGLSIDPSMICLDKTSTHHSIISYKLLQPHNENFASILGAHHGKTTSYKQLQDINAYQKCCGLDDENWKSVQQELLEYAVSLTEWDRTELMQVEIKKTGQVLLSALVIMTDWIASDEALFPLISISGQAGNLSIRADDAWEKLKLTPVWEPEDDWDTLYLDRFGIQKPREVQNSMLETVRNCHKPGIFILEAPMGVGKTEAALVAAEVMAKNTGRGGVFFALPTQATSDAMFGRVLKWMTHMNAWGDPHSVLLAHGKAAFNAVYREIALSKMVHVGSGEEEEYEDTVVHEWFSGRKRGVLSDFVIGTIDHILMAGLKQKHVMLRHLGLSNKVIIIDECHAFDAYMDSYLMKTLRWLGAYGVPVIILSATLPAGKRRGLIEAYQNQKSTPQKSAVWKKQNSVSEQVLEKEEPRWCSTHAYPLITYTDGEECKIMTPKAENRSSKIQIVRLEEEKISGLLLEKLSEGGYAGIIVNTVGRAQKLYEALSELFGEESVCLLHSRFISPDRAKIEKVLREKLGPPNQSGDSTKRLNQWIVIGTQVLELSLDIDFDVMITDLCPMDLLIQRIGRLHRHERGRPKKLNRAICYVLGADEKEFETGSEKIYGKFLLMRTKFLLPDEIRIPDDISKLVQDTYGDKKIGLPMDLQKDYADAKKEQEKRIDGQKQRAEKFQISEPHHGLTTLNEWLNLTIGDDPTGKRAEAAVRDGIDSMEVIVIQQIRGAFRALPWIMEFGGREIDIDGIPSDTLAAAIAGCGVRLPRVLSTAWMIDQVISELERRCYQPLWQKSKWLKGELFLILDENLETELCGFHLRYDEKLGLICSKKEE